MRREGSPRAQPGAVKRGALQGGMTCCKEKVFSFTWEMEAEMRRAGRERTLACMGRQHSVQHVLHPSILAEPQV